MDFLYCAYGKGGGIVDGGSAGAVESKSLVEEKIPVRFCTV